MAGYREVFPEDAFEGEKYGLSWTKMRYEQDQCMPRANIGGEYIPFSVRANLGKLGSITDKSGEVNMFESELGVGVTIYFKLLRFIGLMFLFFTALSIPTYAIYGLNGVPQSIGTGFTAKLSIGNVG